MGGIDTTRTNLLIIARLWSIILFVFDVKVSVSFHNQAFDMCKYKRLF